MRLKYEQYDDYGIQLEIVTPEEISIYDAWPNDDRHLFIPEVEWYDYDDNEFRKEEYVQ